MAPARQQAVASYHYTSMASNSTPRQPPKQHGGTAGGDIGLALLRRDRQLPGDGRKLGRLPGFLQPPPRLRACVTFTYRPCASLAPVSQHDCATRELTWRKRRRQAASKRLAELAAGIRPLPKAGSHSLSARARWRHPTPTRGCWAGRHAPVAKGVRDQSPRGGWRVAGRRRRLPARQKKGGALKAPPKFDGRERKVAYLSSLLIVNAIVRCTKLLMEQAT